MSDGRVCLRGRGGEHQRMGRGFLEGRRCQVTQTTAAEPRGCAETTLSHPQTSDARGKWKPRRGRALRKRRARTVVPKQTQRLVHTRGNQAAECCGPRREWGSRGTWVPGASPWRELDVLGVVVGAQVQDGVDQLHSLHLQHVHV